MFSLSILIFLAFVLLILSFSLHISVFKLHYFTFMHSAFLVNHLIKVYFGSVLALVSSLLLSVVSSLDLI